MRQFLCLSVALCLVVGTGAPAWADEQAEARAVIERAIQAHGGEKNLAKLKAESWKVRGKFYLDDQAVPYTCDWLVQPPRQIRETLETTIEGKDYRLTRVVNGDQGWTRINDDVEPLNKAELEEVRQELFAHWAATLLPLREKTFRLASLGEAKVGDRPAVGVKVSHEGYRDVSLFFDKETGLLLKAQMRVKVLPGGNEVTQETLFSDYREIDGVQNARKFVVKRDGKVYADGEVSDYAPRDKLDDDTFAKP